MAVPSINEVWEQALQINANLSTIHNDLTDLQECCAATNGSLTRLVERGDETNDWLAEIRQLLADGFSTVATGMSGIQDRQDNLIRLAAHQIEQNRTIICALENVSRNTCRILNEAALQTGLQEDIRTSVEATAWLTASAHPAAGLEHSRERKRQEELERCCPPPEVVPACEYRECERPKAPELPTPPSFEGFDPGPSNVERVERPDEPR